VTHQNLRKAGLHLVYCSLFIKLRNLGKGFGGDKPDSCATAIEDAHENKVCFDVSGVEIADFLSIEGHSFLRRPLGLIADSPQVPGEGAVDHYL
jgi:hypothetical protein